MSDNPLYGTPEADLLQIGDGSGADTIYGLEGRDTIFGHAGDDSLVGDGGNDRIWGGEGNDRVDGLDGHDRLFGGIGDDYADAGWGNDTFYGGAGSDTVSAGYGDDLLYGGDGNDTFWMNNLIVYGTDTAYGGADDDVAIFGDQASGHFDGGAGNDTLTLDWYRVGDDYTRRTFVDFGAADHTARAISDYGAADVAVTFENIEALHIQTGYGDDTVIGGGGGDWVWVSVGANLVDAGGGDDTVFYNTSDANQLDGGSGTDTLTVINVNNVLQFDAGGASASDNYGSVITGFERFVVYGGDFGDAVTTGDADDQVYGQRGGDLIHGGGGNDWLDGSHGTDEIHGGDGIDRLIGGQHDDTLNGGAGNDRLFGGRDGDDLYGGEGRDTLVGGSGGDVLWGGDDRDTFRFNSPPETAPDIIGDFTSGVDRLKFMHNVMPGSPDPLHLTDADLSFGAVSGTQGQFLYSVSGSDGLLYWDPDGTGAQGATLMVVLSGAPALLGSDIYIV